MRILEWWLCGANKADYHLDHVGPETLRLTSGKTLLLLRRAIFVLSVDALFHAARGEVGQVFQLGTSTLQRNATLR